MVNNYALLRAIKLFCLFLIFCLSFSSPAAGKDNYKVGLKSLMVWDEATNSYIDFFLWYPTLHSEAVYKIEESEFSVARDAPEAEGLFPLILFSHCSGGSKLSYYDLALKLAKNGFCVVTLSHSRDNTQDTSSVFLAEQLLDRPNNLRAILEFLRNNKTEYGFIDSNKLGLFGIGVGAATMLTLAGAKPDIQAFNDYCQKKPEDIDYCSNWAKTRLNTSMQERYGSIEEQTYIFPSLPIKAMVLAAPAFLMFFPKQTLSSINFPVHILQPELETTMNSVAFATNFKALLPANSNLEILKRLSFIDLFSPCRTSSSIDFYMFCSGLNKDKTHTRNNFFIDKTIKFFNSYLY